MSEPLVDSRHVKVTERRAKLDFAEVIKELIDGDYGYAETIVLVMGNLNTNIGASLYEAFEPAEARRLIEKLEIHDTPKHGSWLDMAERELSTLTRLCLNRQIRDRQTLAFEVAAWEKPRNES